MSSSQAQSDAETVAAPATEPTLSAANELTNEETLQAWQEYSMQLEQTIRALQARDADYQQQLNQANITILQLQDQINSSPPPSFKGEHEEHEAFEFGEFDD